MSEKKLKVAVVGAGGTGAYYGGALAKAGHDVTMIARGLHLAAINEKGLQTGHCVAGKFPS